jgi:hypothetical protein
MLLIKALSAILGNNNYFTESINSQKFDNLRMPYVELGIQSGKGLSIEIKDFE